MVPKSRGFVWWLVDHPSGGRTLAVLSFNFLYFKMSLTAASISWYVCRNEMTSIEHSG